ncbi:P1 family peptidase [Nocardiopsis halophila]|uniref:P1 family peptidase n=1 Tax=Nocardiopsis halophila TaxID=141692 RepID=UPI0003498D37|nr:P1 family peptidase [Nocardiopsis halophila]
MVEDRRTGPANAITDVRGLRVGHAQRTADGWRTGTTVVLAPPEGAVGGVDVRGAAPGTRETDLLDPRNLVERVHAVVLSGGSAFGLDAAGGVVHRLADAGVGLPVGGPGECVPIVPAAVLFDLKRGGDFRAVPDAELGAAAYDAAAAAPSGTAPPAGAVGAGTGALVGGIAGGVGSASEVLADGTVVGALAAVNGAGSAVDPRTGEVYGAWEAVGGEFGGLRAPDAGEVAAWGGPAEGGLAAQNTTIGVVATDLGLTKAQAGKLAATAHDGLARAVRPAHTMVDGDTVFALSTGEGPAALEPFQRVLGAVAEVFARAAAHAVVAAGDGPHARSYRSLFPSAFSSAFPDRAD